MKKIPTPAYTTGFKELSVKLAADLQSIARPQGAMRTSIAEGVLRATELF